MMSLCTMNLYNDISVVVHRPKTQVWVCIWVFNIIFTGELAVFIKVFNAFSGKRYYSPVASVFKFTYTDISPKNESNIPTTSHMVYPDQRYLNRTEALSWPKHFLQDDNWIFVVRFRHFNANKYTQLKASARVILYKVNLNVTIKVNGELLYCTIIMNYAKSYDLLTNLHILFSCQILYMFI